MNLNFGTFDCERELADEGMWDIRDGFWYDRDSFLIPLRS